MTKRCLAWALLLSLASVATATAQVKLSLGAPPIAEVGALHVAKEYGIFAKHGLDVEFLPTGANASLVAAMVSGSHQLASISPTVLLQAIDGGVDLVAVANCGVTSKRTANNVSLVVREGVELKTPADIKGKKIGLPGIGGTLDVWFRQWLKQNDLSPKIATYIEVPIPNTPDVLKRGNIDGVIAGQLSVKRAIAIANAKVAFNFLGELPENLPYNGVVTLRSWAEKNVDTVARFRRAMVEAAGYFRAEPDKTRAAISKHTKLPLDIVNSIELPECNAVASVDQIAWFEKVMRAEGMLQNPIDVTRLLAR